MAFFYKVTENPFFFFLSRLLKSYFPNFSYKQGILKEFLLY
ncbi:hypothetical protein HMPREF9960_0056 [Streptococcus cristatus ATCC 51100]|uniref:Uncharacterized protein n=1 Tax=Streptococcus cristatus ATCC 51100 TaxID=889201 RepID=A0AAV3EGT1_STRCR|nr:hypothetical protein HMPREF9960_0056 [Streptococcus cristatus ATCC 51100]